MTLDDDFSLAMTQQTYFRYDHRGRTRNNAMTSRQRRSESRQPRAGDSMEEVEIPINARGGTDTVAIRRARNRLAARKSRQKRAEKNEELIEQVARLEEQVKYWQGLALQNGQTGEAGPIPAPVAVNARTESPEINLEEEEERLRRELEYLSRKNRVMDLRRQVAEARRHSESVGEERDVGNTGIMAANTYRQVINIRNSEEDEQTSEAAAKRRRVEEYRSAKFNGTVYKGITSLEYFHFTRICDSTFEDNTAMFGSDEAKIDYAIKLLPKDVKAYWHQKVPIHEQTWPTFKTFVLEMPESISYNVKWKHADARQGKDQAVGDFITYVYGLEDQLDPFTDVERRDHLLRSLRPEIVDAIREISEQPQTRSDLVDLAIAIEDRIKYPQTTSVQNHANGRSGKAVSRSANNVAQGASRGVDLRSSR